MLSALDGGGRSREERKIEGGELCGGNNELVLNDADLNEEIAFLAFFLGGLLLPPGQKKYEEVMVVVIRGTAG